MIHIIDKHDCCGCSACVQKCPKQCISMREDDEGFLYPHVDEAECIGCGLCEAVCPLLNVGEPMDANKVLAAKNRDDGERMASSSGGVFIALAKDVIRRGGVVFGAVFDERWEVKHTSAETLDGVRRMMGSKYVQSRVESSFRDAEKFLRAGREVMFVGTPCQIAGLRGYLRKDYDGLLAVELLCHGAPSPGVWRKYLGEALSPSARRAAGKNTVLSSSLKFVPVITGIDFRDKQPYGWEKYSFVVRGEAAFEADKNTVLLSDMFFDNPFMRGFLKNIYLRPSCYRCKCKQGRSKSDLTLGDFWGVGKVMPGFADTKGVSLVLVNTEKGDAAFAALNMETRPVGLSLAAPYNGGFNSEIRETKRRKEFFDMLSSGKSFLEVLPKVTGKPYYKKIYHALRRTLRKVLLGR